MLDVDEMMKQAFAAILRGDYAERDRLCGLAKNVLMAQQRAQAKQPIILGEPIRLPDQASC